MACEHSVNVVNPADAAPSRRRFLQSAGLVGVGAAGLTALGTGTAGATPQSSANKHWRPDTDSPRFTIAVMPDTQYLFDDASIHPAPLRASFDYILARHPEENIVAMAHLGDITQNGLVNEFTSAGREFAALDQRGVTYSVLAGNHDINGSTDDSRGDTPYLQAFGPSRFRHADGYFADSDGYNSARKFRAGGRDWLVLALDWRSSDAGVAWAKELIAANPKTPVILTTHDLVYADETGQAYLGDNGQRLWDDLVNDSDQIFLTLNGHYWPPGRTTKTNAAGHDVHLHITNYQDRYYGGAAMIRLYRFDLERNTIDIETIAPWLFEADYESVNALGRQELELTSDVDRFNVPIDFAQRFQGFSPVPVRPVRPAKQLVVPGTLAYWRFDQGADGTTVPDTVKDLSGRGNDLLVAHRAGRQADALTLSSDHHPDSPSRSSLRFQGGSAAGDYLKTVAAGPLNRNTFEHGFTFEMFFKLPSDWGGANAWSSMLCRQGSSGDAGKTGGYSTEESVGFLNISGSVELQWQVYPPALNTSVTNWGHILPLDTWWHVAITNDGRYSKMYVDGCEVARNPATVTRGIATLNKSWLLGGQENAGVVGPIHYGWIGDVRITDRPLSVKQFLNA